MTDGQRERGNVRPIRRVLLVIVGGVVFGALFGGTFTFFFPGEDAQPRVEVRPSASPVPTVTVSPVETPSPSVDPPAVDAPASPPPDGSGATTPAPIPTL
jgi:hypothetical protein